MNPLVRLANGVRDANAAVPFVDVAGRVIDVAPASYRVGGLSPFVTLGDTVALDAGGAALIKL